MDLDETHKERELYLLRTTVIPISFARLAANTSTSVTPSQHIPRTPLTLLI